MHVEGMTELEKITSLKPYEVTDSHNDHQWMLKATGERQMRNFTMQGSSFHRSTLAAQSQHH